MRKDLFRHYRPRGVSWRWAVGLSFKKSEPNAPGDSALIAGSDVPATIIVRTGLFLGFCLLISSLFLAAPSFADTFTDDWCFEPLGPDGACIADLLPLNRSGCLIQTVQGSFMFWEASPSGFADGLWREIPVDPSGGPLLMVATANSPATPILLTEQGDLQKWIADPSDIGFSDELAASSMGLDISGLPPGGFAIIGHLEPEVAATIAAIVPAIGDHNDNLLLFTKDGDIIKLTGGEINRWPMKFWIHDGASHRLHDTFIANTRARIITAISHPNDANLILIQTEWEGLFYSRDGARSFYSVEGGLPKAVRAICPTDNGFYAACAEGIYRSDDLAVSWNLVEANPPFNPDIPGDFTQLIADPTAIDHLFAITSSGRLYESQTAGERWIQRLTNTPVRIREMAWQDEGPGLIAATSRGILVSPDRGSSWQWNNRGLRQISVLAMAITPDTGDLYLGTDLGFYVGAGQGYEWSSNICAVKNGDYRSVENRPMTGGHHRSDRTQFLTQSSIPCLTDKSWYRLSGNVSAVSIATGNHRTGEDGYQFQRANSYDDFPSLCVGTEGGPVYCAPLEGSDPGELIAGWFEFGPTSLTTSVLALPDGTSWASGTAGGEVWLGQRPARSEDSILRSAAQVESAPAPSDADWSEEIGSIEWRDDRKRFLTPPEMSSTASVKLACLAVAEGGLWLLTADSDQPIPIPPGCEAISVCANGNGIWLGTDQGLFYQMQNTEDRWLPVAFSDSRVIRVQRAANAPVMLCQTTDGIFWSPDGGRSWMVVPVAAEQGVLSLALAPDGSRIYLGTRRGVLATDPPEPRLSVQPPLPITPVPNPFHAEVSLRCRLITPDRGIVAEWAQYDEESDPIIPGLEIDHSPADRSAIEFNGEPAIPESGATDQVTIYIYGVNGQLVRSLSAAEVSSAGEDRYLQWNWDGRNERGQAAPNGIYWAATQIGKQEYAGKIVKFR